MIIFELDGVLADIEHRRHLIKEPIMWIQNPDFLNDPLISPITTNPAWKEFIPDYEAFYEASDKDEPIQATIAIFLNFWDSYDKPVQIWTSRSELYRNQTQSWLMNLGMPVGSYIKMRPIGDHRPAHVIKEEWLLDSALETKWGNKIKVDMVFESDPESISMYRRYGIFVFDCRQK